MSCSVILFLPIFSPYGTGKITTPIFATDTTSRWDVRTNMDDFAANNERALKRLDVVSVILFLPIFSPYGTDETQLI